MDDYLQITFSQAFLRFCEGRTILIDNRAYPTGGSVAKVKRRYNEFLRSASRKVTDRVSRAYRHSLARAAWVAYKEERYEDCELFYEEASLADSRNGWLFDRYAYFLLTRRRYDEALEKAKTATQLISKDSDAWFTRGMIEARLGLTGQALTSLRRAEALGKSKHLCLMQEAYAYLNDTPPNRHRALAALDQAEALTPPDDPYRWKNLEEIHRVRRREQDRLQ